MEKLYAELGMLLVQAEILGTFIIPSQGRIGDVKRQIAEAMNKSREVKVEPPVEEGK